MLTDYRSHRCVKLFPYGNLVSKSLSYNTQKHGIKIYIPIRYTMDNNNKCVLHILCIGIGTYNVSKQYL